jgi:two-component system, cell cycle response regulator
MRVLIAEDDATSRLILEIQVRRLKHEFVSASTGEEAWRLFEDNDVDVVISDREMPGMDGLELCRRIRASTLLDKYVYFIFATSSGSKVNLLDGMEAGADDYLVKPLDPDHLAIRLLVAQRITALHRQLALQQRELERFNARLFELARTDPLTELYNRLKLREDLDLFPAWTPGGPGGFCAIMLDVDYFKAYNDRYGHFAGDVVLKAVAGVLHQNMRPGGRGYRFGGEEFLVIAPAQSLRDGCQAATTFREAVAALALPHMGSPSGVITVSAGVAAWACDHMTVDAGLKRADEGLYQAKEQGRNRVHPAPDDPQQIKQVPSELNDRF